jgi:hypothetical protein
MSQPNRGGRKASDTGNRKARKVQVAGSNRRKSAGKTKRRRSPPRGRKRPAVEDRPVLEPNAAGIDIGAREMYVAVPPDRDEHPVRIFDTFTADLNELADWLMSCGITTVAMESTGVYWIPVYEILEARGIRACVVNARHMKNVPGRRTDWHECQWIQMLHSVGLLRAGFRPEGEVCALRALMRHRGELVQMAASHVQHMHKSLTQMNLQIQHVISDLTGLTGLASIDAILEGQRDPAELAKLRDPRVKAPPEVIEKSLVGHWRSEHLFTLKQSRRLYASYQADRGVRHGDRAASGHISGSGRSGGEAAAAGRQEETQLQQEQKAASPETGAPSELRLTHGTLQAVRGRRDADPGPGIPGAAALQRDRPGHVAVAHGVQFYFLAGAVPRQRHYWRTGAVARETPSPEPCGPVVSNGSLLARPQPDSIGTLSATDEGQTRAAGRAYRYRPQNRGDLLHHS